MAEVPQTEQVWQRSNVTEENLHRMVKDGVLPEKEIIGWRATERFWFYGLHTLLRKGFKAIPFDLYLHLAEVAACLRLETSDTCADV